MTDWILCALVAYLLVDRWRLRSKLAARDKACEVCAELIKQDVLASKANELTTQIFAQYWETRAVTAERKLRDSA